MEIFLYIVHILVSFGLVITILLQSGKGGGLGSGFGGAAASATKIFGGGGTTNVLGRTTVVLAAIFMTTSLSLAYLSSRDDSIMDLNAKDTASALAQEDQIIEEGTGANAPDAVNADSVEPNIQNNLPEGVKLERLDGPPPGVNVGETTPDDGNDNSEEPPEE